MRWAIEIDRRKHVGPKYVRCRKKRRPSVYVGIYRNMDQFWHWSFGWRGGWLLGLDNGDMNDIIVI